MNASRGCLTVFEEVKKQEVNRLQENQGWEMLRMVVDSGASETVLPKEACQHVPTRASVGSLAGKTYAAANGGEIRNEGEKLMMVVTETGEKRQLTMQVCEVNKALLSVSKVCKAGHRVIFDG